MSRCRFQCTNSLRLGTAPPSPFSQRAPRAMLREPASAGLQPAATTTMLVPQTRATRQRAACTHPSAALMAPPAPSACASPQRAARTTPARLPPAHPAPPVSCAGAGRAPSGLQFRACGDGEGGLAEACRCCSLHSHLCSRRPMRWRLRRRPCCFGQRYTSSPLLTIPPSPPKLTLPFQHITTTPAPHLPEPQRC